MWSVGQDWLVLVFPAHRGGRVAIEGTADGCRGAIEEVKVGEVHGKPWSSCHGYSRDDTVLSSKVVSGDISFYGVGVVQRLDPQ